jgi:hypothetical protein
MEKVFSTGKQNASTFMGHVTEGEAQIMLDGHPSKSRLGFFIKCIVIL